MTDTISYLLEQEIGNSPKRIADYLRSWGIKGKINNLSCHPIARLIRNREASGRLSMWSGWRLTSHSIAFSDYQIMDYYFKPPLVEFMRLFAAKEFPDLIEET